MSDKPIYTDSSFSEHLKRREEDDYQPLGVKVKGAPVEKSDDGFVGVAPEYRNFANETERPFQAEDGPEAVIEERYLADDVDTDKGAPAKSVEEAVEESEDEEEQEQQEKKGPTTSTPPPSPTPQS